MQVYVDLNQMFVYFEIDNQSYRMSFDKINGVKIYFGVNLYDVGDRVRIINYNFIDENQFLEEIKKTNTINFDF